MINEKKSFQDRQKEKLSNKFYKISSYTLIAALMVAFMVSI